MKMYTLKCSDVEIKCNYMAEGKTEDEAMKMSSDHIMKNHPDEAAEMAKKYSKDEIDKMMMDAVKEEDM
jgi:predicted small metal-binding protein